MTDLKDTFLKLCDIISKRGLFCNVDYCLLYKCLAASTELTWSKFAYDLHMKFQQTQILIWDENQGLLLPSAKEQHTYFGCTPRAVILARSEPLVLNCLVKLSCLDHFDVNSFDQKFTALLPPLGLSLSVYFTHIRPALDVYLKTNDHQAYLTNLIKLLGKFLIKVVYTDEVEGLVFDQATDYSFEVLNSDLPIHLLWVDPETGFPSSLRALKIAPLIKDERPTEAAAQMSGELDDLFEEDSSWARELDRQIEVLNCNLTREPPTTSQLQEKVCAPVNKRSTESRRRSGDSKVKKVRTRAKKSKLIQPHTIPSLIQSPELPPPDEFSDEKDISDVSTSKLLNLLVEDGPPPSLAQIFAEPDIATLEHNLTGKISTVHGALKAIFGTKLDTADEMFAENLDRLASRLPQAEYQSLATLYVSRVVRDRLTQTDIIDRMSPFVWRLATIIRKSSAKFTKLECFLQTSSSPSEFMNRNGELVELEQSWAQLAVELKATLLCVRKAENSLAEFSAKFSRELNNLQDNYFQRLSEESSDSLSAILNPRPREIFQKLSLFWESALSLVSVGGTVFENYENLCSQATDIKTSLSSLKGRLLHLGKASDEHLVTPLLEAREFDSKEFRSLIKTLQTILAPVQLFAEQFDSRKLTPWQLFQAQLNNVKSNLKGRPSKEPAKRKKRVSKQRSLSPPEI